MKLTVVKSSNLPATPPVLSTAVTFLLLDRFHSPGWIWGMVGTLIGILWILFVYARLHEEQKDIFNK